MGPKPCFVWCSFGRSTVPEMIYKSNDHDRQRYSRNYPPYEDVGCTPAGRVGAEEDREGHVPEDDRCKQDRNCDIHYSTGHVVCFDGRNVKHYLSPHAVCLQIDDSKKGYI